MGKEKERANERAEERANERANENERDNGLSGLTVVRKHNMYIGPDIDSSPTAQQVLRTRQCDSSPKHNRYLGLMTEVIRKAQQVLRTRRRRSSGTAGTQT
jgi:hypothetical protein